MIENNSGALGLASVLIAEDDEFARTVAAEALSGAGFCVYEACDGREAVRVFAEKNPDVVLLDVEMPELDGFEACSAIRNHARGRDTPLMMLTGKEDIASIERSYEAGATDFASKPVNWLVMAKRVAYLRRSGQLTRELRERRQQLEEVHRLAGMGHWTWLWETGEMRCSPRALRIFGLNSMLLSQGLKALSSRIHQSDLPVFEHQLDLARRGQSTPEIEYRIVAEEGIETFVRQRIEARTGANYRRAAAAIVQDVTRERTAERRAEYLARYDRATGLANRQTLLDLCKPVVESAEQSGRQVAMISMGFPQLSEIRLSLGDATANQVLELCAGKLQDLEPELNRAGFSADVGRAHDDEFCIMLAPEQVSPDLPRALSLIEQSIGQNTEIGSHLLNLKTAIGVALFPEDGVTAQSLMQSAGQAMRAAAGQPNARATFANSDRDAQAKKSFIIKNELYLALERSELSVAFQPQLNAKDGALVGVEALARWHHETLGHISPGVFIPLAEEAGLIQELGYWVFSEACACLAQWRQRGLDLRVAVNLSSCQFEDRALAERLLQEMHTHGIQGPSLEIEITESVVLGQSPDVQDALNRLKSEGISIAIDDFGVGHSSLRSLAGFAFDTIKIDRSFVDGLPLDPKKTAITRTILAMARSLGLRTIAEGIELEEQWHFLRDLCDEVQGFYFSKPVAPEDILTFAGKRFSVPA